MARNWHHSLELMDPGLRRDDDNLSSVSTSLVEELCVLLPQQILLHFLHLPICRNFSAISMSASLISLPKTPELLRRHFASKAKADTKRR